MASNKTTSPKSNNSPAKYLTAHFEGYFMFRMATDPDPTNETRGLSGYTMALATEDDLDQKIRLQFTEEFLNKNLREPADDMGLREKLEKGVQVRRVTFDGKPWPPKDDKQYPDPHPLIGAEVSLLDEKGKSSGGSTFESRNNITGSDDTMAFVIDPFHLQIKNEKDNISIKAEDYLNPANREQKIWQILEPEIYGRRLTSSFEMNSQEVKKAINVFDYYGYFYDRRRFLERNIQEFQEFAKDPKKLENRKNKLEEEIKQSKKHTQELENRKNKLEEKIKQSKKHTQELENRKNKLEEEIKQSKKHTRRLEQKRKNLNDVKVQLEQFKSRLYQLEYWGDRVINKLGFKTSWDFRINEANKEDCFEITGDQYLGGTIGTKQPWPVQLWFGGWDGDLLVGYMRGSLSMPFTPDSSTKALQAQTQIVSWP